MSSQFLQLDIYNDTTDNLPLSFTVNRTEDIINNQDRDLSIGISRFYIPSDLITPYSTSSNMLGSYKIGLYVKELNGSSNKYFTSTLSKSGSIVDIMNSCNYSLIDGYYSLIRSMGNVPNSGAVDYSYIRQLYRNDFANTLAFTFSGASPNDTTGQGKLQTEIGNISFTDGTGHDIYGIKLKISKFYLLSVTNEYANGFELNLVAPSGKKINIFTNQFNLDNTFNQTVRDWNFADYYNDAVDISLNSGYFYPREMFSKLYAEEASGSWKLELSANKGNISASSMNIRLEGSFELMARKTDSSSAYHALCPRLSPFLNLDSNDKITFNYSEKFGLTGFRMILSKSLNAILKLPAKNILLDSVNYDLIELPAISCEATTPSEFNSLIVNQTYGSNNTAKIATDIYKLVFKTTLPINPTIIANSQRAAENVLTDYIIESYDNEYYTFSWDYPNRMFDVISTTHINNFTLQVFIERLDGSRELVYIMPNKRSNILLMIKKNNTQF